MGTREGLSGPEGLLQSHATTLGHFVGARERPLDSNLWDSLASINPIQAAISVEDVQSEATKSERIIDFLERVLPEGRVVDLGCGYGRIAKYLLRRREFETYVGVDDSVTMLELFHERYRESPEERRTPVTLVKSDIGETLLEDRSVDAVFSCAVLLHNPKPTCGAAVREAHRVLKPGGKLVLVDSLPNRFSVNGLFGSAYELAYLLKGERDRNGPVRYWREQEVETLFSDFRSMEIIRSGFAPMPRSLPLIKKAWNDAYRRAIMAPGERIASRAMPRSTQKHMCFSFDVVAVK